MYGISVYTADYPEYAAEKANADLEGKVIDSISTATFNTGEYVLTVAWHDEPRREYVVYGDPLTAIASRDAMEKR